MEKNIANSSTTFLITSKHILINNLEPLNLLNINFDNIQTHIEVSSEANLNVNKKLEAFNVSDFVIFHPSTQYNYKIYPQNLRDILLSALSKLGGVNFNYWRQ